MLAYNVAIAQENQKQQRRDIFQPAAKTDVLNEAQKVMSLNNISIKSLCYSGYLRSKNRFLALLIGPGQRVYPVKSGDLVGKEHYRIVTVSKSKMLLARQASLSVKNSQDITQLKLSHCGQPDD